MFKNYRQLVPKWSVPLLCGITFWMVAVLIFTSRGQPSVRFEAGRSTIQNIYFTEMEMSYKAKLPIKGIEIFSQTYGSFLNWASFRGSENMDFIPVEITYKIGQKFIYKHVFIKFEHYCSHPVIDDAIGYYDFRHNFYFDKLNVSPYWWRGVQETMSFGFEYTFK